MLNTRSSITVIAGHYGSGKTEFAVNFAFWEAQKQSGVILVDLDIVNPYFCSREQEKELAAAGVELIAQSQQCRIADVPALPAEIAKIFSPGSGRAILDAGGDGPGAKVLSQYMPRLEAHGYDMWLVLNANRPQTADVEGALTYIAAIERASRLKISGIVNNTHLCGLTTAADILKGSELAGRVSEKSGLSVICSTVPKGIAGDSALKSLSEPLFPIDIRMKKPWEL